MLNNVYTIFLLGCLMTNQVFASDILEDLETKKAEEAAIISKVLTSQGSTIKEYPFKLKGNNLVFDQNGNIIMHVTKNLNEIDLDNIFDHIKFTTTLDKEKTYTCAIALSENSEFCDHPFYSSSAAGKYIGNIWSIGKALVDGKVGAEKKFDEKLFAKVIYDNKDKIKIAVERIRINESISNTKKSLFSKIDSIESNQKKDLEILNKEFKIQKFALDEYRNQQLITEDEYIVKIQELEKELIKQQKNLTEQSMATNKLKQQKKELQKLKQELASQKEQINKQSSLSKEIEKQKQELEKLKEEQKKSQQLLEKKQEDNIEGETLKSVDNKEIAQQKKEQEEVAKQQEELEKLKEEIAQQKKEQEEVAKQQEELEKLKEEIAQQKKEQEEIRQETINYLLKDNQ